MAFGAENIIWACYTAGWWSNQVVDENGEKTQQYAKMQKINDCVHCDACKSRCPYGLDTPALLQRMLADYDSFYAKHHND